MSSLRLPTRYAPDAAFFALLIFLFACAALGCSTAPYHAQLEVQPYAPAQHEVEPREEAASEVEPAQLRYVVMPMNPRPGDPITIGVNAGFGVESALLVMGQRRFGRSRFFPVACEDSGRSFYATLLTVPTTAGMGSATIVLETAEGIAAEIPLEIAHRMFLHESIPVTTAPVAATGAFWASITDMESETRFLDAFVRPVGAARRSSPFGARRIFIGANGVRSNLIHAGIDYAVPTGTPVLASGSGRVMLARYQRVAGNSVIIEHLPGVFSIYYHLDSIGVREGDMIEVGAVLGHSGNTGFSTGPHLHWEVRVFGEVTDPDALVARPLIDKTDIFSRLGY